MTEMTHGTPPPPPPVGDGALRERLLAVRQEVAKAVVGQDAAVSGLLVALLCGGHVLMEGVPGTAKTLLVRTLASSLSVQTRRVQFTPDLMPGDITGSLVIDSSAGELSFREGPIFTNLLLADEINRTPPKTQSALLEAMEEGQVSADGVTRPLPRPFLVAATQNPVEFEGTYPLPEAQLDRFLLKVVLPVPPRDDEVTILTRHAAGFDPRDVAGAGVSAVASGAEVHGHIPELVAPIDDAIAAVMAEGAGLQGTELVNAVVEENVWQSIADLLGNSPAVAGHVQSGGCEVHGAVYDILTGEVRWLGAHPQQAELIAAASKDVMEAGSH